MIPVDLRVNFATPSVLAAHSDLVFHSSVTLAVHSLMTHVLLLALLQALVRTLLQALVQTLLQYLSVPSAPSLILPPLLVPIPPLPLLPLVPILPLPLLLPLPLVLIPLLLPLPLVLIPLLLPLSLVPGVHGATINLVRTRNTIITENIKDITVSATKP